MNHSYIYHLHAHQGMMGNLYPQQLQVQSGQVFSEGGRGGQVSCRALAGKEYGGLRRSWRQTHPGLKPNTHCVILGIFFPLSGPQFPIYKARSLKGHF